MYLDWILTIGAILIIVFLLYAIYILVQPGFTPEGFLVQTPNQVYTIPQLNGIMGRYVRIRPSLDANADGYLTISQIEVLDINGKNVALKKPVTATSVGGSPIDKKYGDEVLVGSHYEYAPGVSNSKDSIVDGFTIPRNNLTGVFETAVQNKCSGISKNCPDQVTTDTEYIEIDLGKEFLISSVVYTGRDDSETRTIQTIDGDYEYLTQIDRIKGMRLEIYDEQRREGPNGPLTYISGLNYSTTFPTKDKVQTIKIPDTLYGVNNSDTSGGSGSRIPLTTVMIPNLESFNTFIKPFQNIKPVYSPREQDKGKSPIALAYAPMLAGIRRNVYSNVNIDISNNILLPILMESPLNFYYDIYKQSGCSLICRPLSDGTKQCTRPEDVNETITIEMPDKTKQTIVIKGEAYCKPDGITVNYPTELVSVNIFGSASTAAIQEMNQSIEYCKLLYLGSPPAIENFIRVDFSFTNLKQGYPIKAYLRSKGTNSAGGSGSGSGSASQGNIDLAARFCLPDLIQKFRGGAFVTVFSGENSSWNSINCTTEITPEVLGLIPFVSRNFITQWVANRTTRYKRFYNTLSSNIASLTADFQEATNAVQKADNEIKDAVNPDKFSSDEKIILGVSAVSAIIPTIISVFNPVYVWGIITAIRAAKATEKKKGAETAADAINRNLTQLQTGITASDINSATGQISEITVPMELPTYISINSKTMIDSIAQQFYELLGGQFNITYFYDILPLGRTMLDIRFDLDIHDSFSSVNGPINDLKAQYLRIRNSTTVSKDVLDQAEIDYQSQLSTLEGKTINSIANPFQGAVARLFYTKSGPNINITGLIFDDRAVTSFIPELNGGLPVSLGPTPGNVNYKPTVLFTKNVTEALDCRNKDTLRRIFDDYIVIMNSSKNKYPLASATPPLDVTKGILYVKSVLGASQITDKSCNITWTEGLYDTNTNIPLNLSGSGSAPEYRYPSAETGANTYMPLYAYIFGIWILHDTRPIQVSVIKIVRGLKIYIIETSVHIKMVADDSVGTARYYDKTGVTNWVDVATSWNENYWIDGTSAGTRADGGYMLYLEGVPLQTAINPSAKPVFVKTANGRIISMYGDLVVRPTTRKHPVYDVKNIGGINIYISETFTSQNARINMVADDAVGTAKYILKTGNISVHSWNNSYWTDGISAGVRSDGHCMIDKDEPIGLNSGSASPTSITRSATFTYRSDQKNWYSSELILDLQGIELLRPNSATIGTISPFTNAIEFTKPLPTRSTLDNLSNICPKASCDDPDILYSLVDQYNSDPTLAGSILTVTHAFTPNPNQCDVKVSINYDSQIKDILGTEGINPETGQTKKTYENVTKGAVTYSSGSGTGPVMGSKPMPHTGVQTDITIALYVAVDPTTCKYNLIDASGQNSGTSIQSNTPSLFTPMIYSKEFVNRNTGAIGSSINKLQTEFDQAVGSTNQTLKSYRIQGHNALSDILSVSGIASCTSGKCDSPSIIQKIKEYYVNSVTMDPSLEISNIINTAQTDKNACEMTFLRSDAGPNATPMAYKFIFGPSSCSITSARQIFITGPTDEQILDITKEMNAGVTESFVPSRAIESEAIGVRGFGRDIMRNSESCLKDTQYELPLKQQEDLPTQWHGIPSYKFLRFTPTETRGKEASAVNVGKFTFFYENQPLLLKGTATNPMGTWEGQMKDVTGPGTTSGWSDSHKKPLVFAFREPIAIDAYSFTTSLPQAGIEGDPVSWKLESSQNGTFWTVRDTQTSFPTPVGRFTETRKLYFTGQRRVKQ
jgi:hypothetical protein